MAGRGPLPKPADQRRRRNAPTIPTTSLPAAGRKGAAPKVPSGYVLGAAGRAWWKWAWALPHAAAWSDGELYVVARRAVLEDELSLLSRSPGSFDLSDLDAQDLLAYARTLLGADDKVKREIRELEDRLGLNPKAFAALRWSIVDDAATVEKSTPTVGRRDRLHVVA